MKKLYFITGSQDLYGEETLARVAEDGREMAGYLSGAVGRVAVEWQPVVRNSDEIFAVCMKASADPDCVGVITWMHTFSPAKMWIRGLQALAKPMLHLHTQYNEKLPYSTIDMDFMNLNQSAHGDREFGYICTRPGGRREIVVGYYRHARVVAAIRKFADTAVALDFSRGMRVAMFGGNMRDVAVTDGDRVESEIRYGWSVNYYGPGDLADIVAGVKKEEVKAKMREYAAKYEMRTDLTEAVEEQAKYEVALRRFIEAERINAFTDTFQDLHGLRQLPQGRPGHIPAAHCDGAFQSPASAMLEQPVDELNDRGLTAPALTGEKDQFSRFYGKRAVPKAGLRLPFIGVRHMVEGDHGSTPLQQIPPKHRARNSRTTVTS